MSANQNPAADPNFTDPVEVSDFLLEKTRKAYFDRDFDAFRQRFLLPKWVGSYNGERLIETVSALREVYDNMCAFFDSQGVIDLRRRTLSATFETPDVMRCTYVQQYVLTGYALTEELVALGTCRRVDGMWKVSACNYATDIPEVNRVLVPKTNTDGAGSAGSENPPRQS